MPEWLQSKAATDVLDERRRQVEDKGFGAERDDAYGKGELGLAAALYALPYDAITGGEPLLKQDDFVGLDMALTIACGWNLKTEPDERKRLVKAGALVIAEIERLDRATPPAPTPDTVHMIDGTPIAEGFLREGLARMARESDAAFVERMALVEPTQEGEYLRYGHPSKTLVATESFKRLVDIASLICSVDEWTSNSWRRLTTEIDGRDQRQGGVLCPVVNPSDGHPDLDVSEADMAHIAAARPEVVLALIALARRAEAAEAERDAALARVSELEEALHRENDVELAIALSNAAHDHIQARGGRCPHDIGLILEPVVVKHMRDRLLARIRAEQPAAPSEVERDRTREGGAEHG